MKKLHTTEDKAGIRRLMTDVTELANTHKYASERRTLADHVLPTTERTRDGYKCLYTPEERKRATTSASLMPFDTQRIPGVTEEPEDVDDCTQVEEEVIFELVEDSPEQEEVIFELAM